MRFFYFLLIVVCVSCNSAKSVDALLQLSLQRSILLDSLPSGSGLAFTNSKAIVMSDNMDGFFVLDTASLQHRFIGFDSTAAKIKDKDIKLDLESATKFNMEGREWVIALGSGSVSATREKILLIPVDNTPQLKLTAADSFYSSIKQKLGITTAQLNLEACFASNDSLYLLNRGTNQSISIALPDLFNCIKKNFQEIPPIQIQKFVLPVIDGFNASFSGACAYKKDHFLFSATVEKTSNWVDDGEVAGSFIGLAHINGSVIQVVPLKNREGMMVKEKIESIEWIKLSNKESLIYAISDNDNGKSTWFILKANGLL
jgi:hypothetical protein